MKNINLKDVFTFICVLSAIVTSGIIILTFLTTYHFINTTPMYNSYLPLQIGICITMALWGIRFLISGIGEKRYIYAAICMVSAIISLFFIISLIK